MIYPVLVAKIRKILPILCEMEDTFGIYYDFYWQIEAFFIHLF